MRGSARDKLHLPQLLQLPESFDQSALVAIYVGVANLAPAPVIHESEGVKLGLLPGPLDFLFGQFNQTLKSALIARLQQRIKQHRNQGGS